MKVLAVEQGTLVHLNGAWFLCVEPKDGGHHLFKYIAPTLDEAIANLADEEENE